MGFHSSDIKRNTRTFTQRGCALVALLLLTACNTTPSLTTPTSDPVTVRLNLFRGSSNIPIYMAIEKGYFARQGITPLIAFTPNSEQQRAGLAAGAFDIAQAAVDNAVAMRAVAGIPVVIVAGGDLGMNELVASPDIGTPSDLRGHTLVVDAPNTAYALIGRKILKNAGLVQGQDYQLTALGGSESRTRAMATLTGSATVLNPPWNLIAKARGAKSLGSTAQLYGPYQAQGIFVLQPWAIKNAAVLERFLAAYIEGCRATQDPAQRDLTLKVLARELKLDAHIAELTYTELNKPGSGMTRDCKFDQHGFENVLALRAEMEGQWDGKPPQPEQFLDLRYFDHALKSIQP